MKFSRKQTNRKAHACPILRFETHQLTAFSGIVVLPQLFGDLNLMDRLKDVFHSRQAGKIFRPQKLFLQLILH